MDIKKEEINSIIVFALTGRLNITTIAPLEEELSKALDNQAKKVLIDCVALEYISSAGLRVFLVAAKNAKKVGGEIALAGLNPTVKQVFEISGFANIFPIFNSKDDALANL